MLLLLPADPLDPRRPDPHFGPEGDAARGAGHAVGLMDHDAFASGLADCALLRLPGEPQECVYRGWMLRSEEYEALAREVDRQGFRLRTSAGDYQRAHELPGWFDALAQVTPESRWTDGPDLEAFEELCLLFGTGPAVLRDFTKSLKHHWHEAGYIPDVADRANARQVAERFLELRGEDLVGGLVLRRFEEFVVPETRTWWVDGRCVLVTAHPDSAATNALVPDLDEVTPLIAALGLPFATVDMTQRVDGVWRVVELGDGQVSDRPKSTAPAELVSAITRQGCALQNDRVGRETRRAP